MAEKSASTQPSRRKGQIPKSAWKPGQSGNPKGRPPNEKTITKWFNEFGNKSPQALAEELAHYARELRQVKGDLPMFGHVALRALMSLINEPDARLLAQVLDRTEGKVMQSIKFEDWRKEAADNGVLVDELIEQFKRALLSAHSDSDPSTDAGATDTL